MAFKFTDTPPKYEVRVAGVAQPRISIPPGADNHKEVAKLTRAQAGGDGIAGLRINHNLHLQVSKFEVKKLP